MNFKKILPNNTANPTQFGWKWAGLALLFSRQLPNGSQDFFNIFRIFFGWIHLRYDVSWFSRKTGIFWLEFYYNSWSFKMQCRMKKWLFVTYRYHLARFQSHLQQTVSFLDKFIKKKWGFSQNFQIFFFSFQWLFQCFCQVIIPKKKY